MKLPVLLASATLLTAACCQSAFAEECSKSAAANGYPTEVIADYVLGCMLSNGKSPDLLRKCSCSMDFIAESIPYDEYERVETLLGLQQMQGQGRVAVYKGSTWAKAAVTNLREVQAESTLRCF